MVTAEQLRDSGVHSAIKYRPDIDGLRAIAVTSVVAYHCGLGWFRGGFVGVDIFFVISGYLIGSLVYKEIRGRSFRISKFYGRRAKRILPALFGVLMFSYVAATLLLSPLEMKDFARGALATIASSSNILFWLKSGYFAANADQNPLLMTWSLGVEEQFYVIFPLLMLLLRRLQERALFAIIAGLALLSFVLSIAGTPIRPDATFYLLPTRAWELAAGILLAMLEANRRHAPSKLPAAAMDGISLIGLALMGVAIFTFSTSTPFPGYAALLPVVGTVLIIAARQGIVNRLLSWQPFVFVGLISYSWYLWHWPLLSFARICSDSGISTAVAITLSLVSFACAVLSWRFIEQPFRKSATPTPLLLKRYAAVAVAMMVPAVLFGITHGLPQRNRSVQQMEIVGEPLRHDVCVAPYGASHPILAPPCVPLGQGRAVAVIGDSHAAALADGFRPIAARQGYRLVELTKGSCPALQGVSAFSIHHPMQPRKCAEFNREVTAYLQREPQIDAVVIVGVWSGYLYDGKERFTLVPGDENPSDASVMQSGLLLEQGLNAEIDQLEHMGKVVYLFQDNNSFSFDPMRHMRTYLISPRHFMARLVAGSTLRWPDGVAPPSGYPEDAEARRLVAVVSKAHPEVHLVDPQETLCSAVGCRFALGNQSLFVDTHHLSSLGAQTAFSGLELP
jgi:peptidoglycan/LPS O-acetylase OafA/YrhL